MYTINIHTDILNKIHLNYLYWKLFKNAVDDKNATTTYLILP
jgi:hypothetical protein